jgi:hypothetical protein
MTNAVNIAQSGSNNVAWRNRIINGGTTVAQRGNVNVTAAGGNTYVATDRFSMTNYWGSGQVNTTQSTTAPAGFANSLSLTVNTAAPMSGSTGYFANVWQAIEGFNISDAYTGEITLSFWVRSSITGTYSVTFSNVRNTGISTGARLYVVNYTINAANTWEQKIITLSLSAGVASGTWDTTNGTGLCVAWNLGAESNRKGDTFLNTWGTWGATGLQSASQVNWISNSGATFFLTGIQLERGTAASPFEYRDYGRELAMCQRYFLKWTGDSSATGFPMVGTGNISAPTTAIIFIPTPAALRTTPTVSFSGSVSINDAATQANTTSIAQIYAASGTGFWTILTASGGAFTGGNGAIVFIQNASTNSFSASSEL